MPTPSLKILPAEAYFEALTRQLPRAKHRIVVHAMGILWGPATAQLVPLLLDAAKRGAEVRVVGDIYSKFTTYMPRPFREKLPAWREVQVYNDRLRAGGVRVTYVGTLGLNPFKRRCHTKWTIIDDLVYTFGGINIGEDSLTNRDFMLETRNPGLADYLYDLTGRIEAGGNASTSLPDHTKQLSDDATLLFDGGAPGRSVIYETACSIVADAKKIYFVSQMCPSGRLGNLITARENQCYFVNPEQAEFPANIALVRDKLRYRITNHYRGKSYIHAKLILTEQEDGSRHLITGSNNFSWRGIAFGTKEIALHSTDPVLWQALYNFIQEEVAT